MARPKKKRRKRAHRDLTGLSFAILGRFTHWPSYHEGTPEDVVRRYGGQVRHEVSEGLDFVVIADGRARGRAEARRKAESLRRKAKKRAETTGEKVHTLEILDEDAFRAMVKIDVRGKSFAFFGDFDYCYGGIEEGRPPILAEAAGGLVRDRVDEDLDYLVLGDRRGAGKTAALRRARELQAEGGGILVLSEAGFLELIRAEQPAARQFDFPTFISQLRGIVDPRKLTRAFKMLKAESFQLYVDVAADRLVGVVRSQTTSGTTYASWLAADGRYGCAEASAELYECMGLQGRVCKHLLVLLVGLARTGGLEPETAYRWIRSAARRRPARDEDLLAETVLRYKGAEAGEVDWRPLETIPEDYYAF